MAKRRARIEARVSKLKRKQPKASSGGDDAPAAPQPQTHIRKMQKRVRFLEKVKTSALAARAAVFKRKRKAQGIISLDSLEDALPELLSLAPGATAAPQFLARGARVVHKGARMRVCAAETTRFAAVLSNSVFLEDPISAVTAHVLANLPKPAEVAKVARGGSNTKRAKQQATARGRK